MEDNQREYELAEEMESLARQIENGRKTNKKIKFKTFGRRTLQILKLGTAIVFCPALSSICCLAFGWNPYKLNEPKKPTCTVSYIDSEGNKTKYDTDIAYTNKYYNTITYYDTWKKLDDNSYIRNIYNYKATSDSLLELVGILQTAEEINTELIEELISEKLTNEIEIKENLSKEELNKGAFIEGVYYDENKDKRVLVKENKKDHNSALLGFAALNILLMIIEFIALSSGTYFFENFASAFSDSDYLIDIKSLQKRLEQVTKELQDEVTNKPKRKKLSK